VGRQPTETRIKDDVTTVSYIISANLWVDRPGIMWWHMVWPNGFMVRASHSRLEGYGFDSRPFRFQVTTYVSCSHTHTRAYVTEHYKLD